MGSLSNLFLIGLEVNAWLIGLKQMIEAASLNDDARLKILEEILGVLSKEAKQE